MPRPPQISRSFPLMTLLMAIPLAAILGYVAYTRYVADDAASDEWWTYRNDRHGYELRLPPDWEIIYETQGTEPNGTERQTVIIAPKRPSTPNHWPYPRVFANVNFHGDWCTSTLGMTTEAIDVSGVRGEEHVCILAGPVADHCTPKPRCIDVPWGVMRDFERNGNRFWVFGDVNVATDDNAQMNYEAVRRAVQSFRFVD